jgi:hypothetical protein
MDADEFNDGLKNSFNKLLKINLFKAEIISDSKLDIFCSFIDKNDKTNSSITIQYLRLIAIAHFIAKLNNQM